MKILLAFFKIQDYGGLVGYAEKLATGLKEIGNEVHSVVLTNSGVSGTSKSKDRSLDEGWEWGHGLMAWQHPKNGFEGLPKYNYTVTGDWSGYPIAYDCDLVIYVTPVPSASKHTKGDSRWVGLFEDIDIQKQIVTIHDSNLRKLYPYIYKIHECLDYIVCVHESSWNTSSVIPCKRSFILNPHDIDPVDTPAIDERPSQICSVQIFKYWKRVDKFVRLIPHLDLDITADLAGTGIEYYYMTSLDKVKPKYLYEDGTSIWDKAINEGMIYHGVVNSEDRTHLFRNSRILVDFSNSKLLQTYGPVSNRTIIEAMVQGCVPALVEETMEMSQYFKPFINYLPIPFNNNSEEQANLINNWIEDVDLLNQIRENNYTLAKQYGKKRIAQKFIDLINDDIDYIVGEVDDNIVEKAEHKFKHFTS